ncbi:DUF262 domain-containing protein [Kamptonema animale CS-326]|jgi:uncharacterized protein with ParB-like and HNH nuclease domain|uniref:DUF262 domain-containing protein n=1 Tax=Kamptonema animale TaxID=92934 RepID=UPI00232E3485|nr:DUF262 domain-containing protein [Kamptonema animale]MDB9510696.1 DUF262 domain-containing protein [Kamptonema animale CS-326]
MDAKSFKISKVFSAGGAVHYIMPPFQREYSWEKPEWEVLLKDAIAIYEEYNPDSDPDREPEHFIGSLVVINDGTRNGTITAHNLVDGQQRLTTLSLLFLVLRDLVKPTDPKLANKINKFVVNSDEEGEGEIYFKILPTNKYGDRQAYQAIISEEKPNQPESGIPKAYNYFRHEIESTVKESELDIGRFFTVLQNCFQVVFIELNKNESPYHIFESLNAKGKPLTQADLVRNYIAMMLPTSQQENAFTKYWEKIEGLLQEKRTVGKSRMGELTAFIRHYLAMQTRNLCAESHICARFRDYCKELDDRKFVQEIANLLKFAEYYNKLLRPETEVHQDIKTALIRLNTLDLSTTYPFLLMLYNEYNSKNIDLAEFIESLTLLENYLVRRYICGKQTNYLNRIFPSLWKDITAIKDEDEEITLPEALQKVLITKQYPNNNDVRQSINSRPLYDKNNPKKIGLVIETINRHLSKGTDGYTVLNKDKSETIEHILPQEPSKDWEKELGDELKQLLDYYLHTLGNLTLVTSEWNAQLSNSAFLVKKQKLAKHALQINNDYFSQSINRWDKQAILERANFLSNKFIEIWPSLGEQQVFPTPTFSKPKLMQICGDEISLSKQTWRQLTIQCCEWVIEKDSKRFENARNRLKSHFRDNIPDGNSEEKGRWHELSNGCWINLNKSGIAHIDFCRRFLKAVGISEADWSIEYVKD